MGYWLVNTAGIGSLIVLSVGLSVLAAYVYMLRWIQTAPPDAVRAEANPQPQRETEAGGESA